jgi:hypothetical protein
MGLGRKSHHDKRPIRTIPFHIDLVRKELAATNSLDKKAVPVVQYKDEAKLSKDKG